MNNCFKGTVQREQVHDIELLLLFLKGKTIIFYLPFGQLTIFNFLEVFISK